MDFGVTFECHKAKDFYGSFFLPMFLLLNKNTKII